VTDLRAPLVPPDVDLRKFGFMPLHVASLRDSDLSVIATGDEFRAAVLLWCFSWHQLPAASVPDDDEELASICGYNRAQWRKVKAGALRGFVKCSDGRLYHPKIAQDAMRAWTRHHLLRNAATRLTRSKRMKGTRWQKIRVAVLDRDGWACMSCGARDVLEVDHIKPLAAGGSHDMRNLQCLCRPCNRRKSFKVAA
jgi:uncharacterized protein YdaU (DUF1376 family)